MDMKQLIYEATLFIHDNYNKQINVTDISSRAYLSPSYFSSVFRILTGYTVKNYLNRYRLYTAAMSLKESTKQIIEIAFDSGFSSQQSFTKRFSQAYGTTPAQFRLLKPKIETFPPENIWQNNSPSMALMDCFKDVTFVKKEELFVIGIEVDINYNTKGGTDPIGDLVDLWNQEQLKEKIPNRVNDLEYGITHGETIENTAKYFLGVEVNELNQVPVGLIGRKFLAADYAVFNTTLEIIWTGEFWRTFYTKWLPSSGYMMREEAFREKNATFSIYPAIEVYDSGFKDEKSILQIYAPVVKK